MGKSFLEIKGGDIEGQIAFNKKQTPEITPKLEEDASDGGTNTILFCLRYRTTDARCNSKEHARMFGEDIYQHLDNVQRFINTRGVIFDTLVLQVLYSGDEWNPERMGTGEPPIYFFDMDNPEGERA